jgi:hypothetical protein
MGGESSPLVMEIESPKSSKMTHAGDQVDNNPDQATDQVDNNTDQVTDQVSTGAHCADDSVKELIAVLGDREISASERMRELGLKHRPSFRERYLEPSLVCVLIERTIPDRPTSSKQKYRKVKR